MKCDLCPRHCRVDRDDTQGFCQSGILPRVARAGLHQWEEPCISGERGSGTIFFSGCNLKCVFCQNYVISHENLGKEIGVERLGEIMDELWQKGAHNINLVSASHYVHAIWELFEKGYEKKLPIVYNCGGYESVETLKRLENIVDIYLPDMKYADNTLAKRYSGAGDYVEVAQRAIEEMYRQKGNLVMDADSIAQKGVLIRHLVLPGHTNNSMQVLEWVKERFGTDVYCSLMCQYVPEGRACDYPPIHRKLTTYEYEKVCAYARQAGFENVYVQERDAADKKYIPSFDFTGI